MWLLGHGILAGILATTMLTEPVERTGPPAGSIRFILHGITVQPPHHRPRRGVVKEPLFDAYRLATGVKQKASVAFRDRTVMHINERTDLMLRASLQVMMQRGEVGLRVTHGSHVQVRTDLGIVTAVGTLFDVRIARTPFQAILPGYTTPKTFPAGTENVSVVNGVVQVSTPYGSVAVHAGRWTHLVRGKAPTPPVAHKARNDLIWTVGLP